METIEWIKQLIDVESVITWEGHDIVRTLTQEEQAKAKDIVSIGSEDAFVYVPTKSGYHGTLFQNKMLPWGTLYPILLQLPFYKCECIMLPLNDEIMKCLQRNPKRADEIQKLGFVPARPSVRKEDNYIACSIYLSTRFESYDEDGYGGGDEDSYIVGIIDPQGRWAMLPKECIDIYVQDTKETHSAEFLPETMRQSIF